MGFPLSWWVTRLLWVSGMMVCPKEDFSCWRPEPRPEARVDLRLVEVGEVGWGEEAVRAARGETRDCEAGARLIRWARGLLY